MPMLLKNTDSRYGLIAIFLHWLLAILIIGQLTVGIYMTGIPVSAQKLQLYGWHKEFGVLIFMLFALRMSWRYMNVAPSLSSLPAWQAFAARAVHWAFYFFIVVLPITGWIITSAAGLPISFFGLFTIPVIISPNENTRVLFGTIHQWLAYGLIAFIAMHTLAALEHHFIRKDDILRRMLP